MVRNMCTPCGQSASFSHCVTTALYSFRSLSCDRPAVSPQSTIWCFPFQFAASLRSSSSCLRLLSRVLVPYILSSVMYCRRRFLRKMWPILSTCLPLSSATLLLRVKLYTKDMRYLWASMFVILKFMTWFSVPFKHNHRQSTLFTYNLLAG
jgi:hypothetical protein